MFASTPGPGSTSPAPRRPAWAPALLALVAAVAVVAAVLAMPGRAAAQAQEPLTVTLAGGGTGSVQDSDYDIHCPTTCSYDYDQGSVVELTASPDSGMEFVGWGGACSGTQSCIVTMNAAENVTATFAEIPPPVQYTLHVGLAGSGTGQVRDTNYDFLCPTTCSDTFNPGDEVELVAGPDTGSTFAGWSGAGCSGTQSCIVTMHADENVVATFLAPGSGTVKVPVPKRRRRQIRARITMGWRWNASRTTLTKLSLSKLPARATIVATCTGPKRPFKSVRGTRRRLGRFERRLVGRRFHAGDKLTLKIAAKGMRSERARITIRRERKPLAKLL